MGLTPADIRNKRFRTVRLRTGYNEQDVDTLLDRVEATLAALRGDPQTQRLITAEEVMASRFRGTRLATGYNEDDVDDFLDVVAADLRERGLATTADRSCPDAPADPTAARRADSTKLPPPLSEPSSGHPTMRPEDVRGRRFATTRLTTGYNEQEVDEFLDSAEATLRALLEGRPEHALLTSTHVDRVRFATTRARPGYDPGQVDAFLDELAEELRRYESH